MVLVVTCLHYHSLPIPRYQVTSNATSIRSIHRYIHSQHNRNMHTWHDNSAMMYYFGAVYYYCILTVHTRTLYDSSGTYLGASHPEIRVPRSVDDIQDVFSPGKPSDLAHDGDATLALQVVAARATTGRYVQYTGRDNTFGRYRKRGSTSARDI